MVHQSSDICVTEPSEIETEFPNPCPAPPNTPVNRRIILSQRGKSTVSESDLGEVT